MRGAEGSGGARIRDRPGLDFGTPAWHIGPMTEISPAPAPPAPAKPRRSRLMPALVAAAVAGIAVGVALVLPRGIATGTDTAECAAAVQTAARISPLVKGEIAAFVPASRPLRLPDLAFKDKAVVLDRESPGVVDALALADHSRHRWADQSDVA